VGGIQVSSQHGIVCAFPLGRYWCQPATLVIEFESKPPGFVLVADRSWLASTVSDLVGHVLRQNRVSVAHRVGSFGMGVPRLPYPAEGVGKFT
jgi:hypothetical protein